MLDVTTEGDSVVFAAEGLDKLWSFGSRLDLPLAHATAVEHDPEVVGRWWHGVHGELVFGDVRHSERAIIVSLQHER
jgi:hypothetical protein